MFVRSPLYTWISNPEWYYRSLTARGTVMGYVFPTLVAMGFGYAITESALKQRLVGVRWAWAGFWLIVLGAVMAMVPVALGRASVLYTFYPPLIGNVFYYIGVVLVVVGSWIWVALMSTTCGSGGAHPGEPVPLAMFANEAGSYLWAWTAVGAALELLLQIIPVALGLKTTIDAGLARVFFSWTLHAIVYFWLIGGRPQKWRVRPLTCPAIFNRDASTDKRIRCRRRRGPRCRGCSRCRCAPRSRSIRCSCSQCRSRGHPSSKPSRRTTGDQRSGHSERSRHNPARCRDANTPLPC
jgi:hypothetical protein